MKCHGLVLGYSILLRLRTPANLDELRAAREPTQPEPDAVGSRLRPAPDAAASHVGAGRRARLQGHHALLPERQGEQRTEFCRLQPSW